MKSKRKLMVVDDEQSISIIIEINLSATYEIIEKSNGSEALEYLYEGNIPDAIVLDLNMPGMNGLSFIKEVRKSAFFKDIPLVVLSSDETTTKKIECLKAGADDYLIKPFNPEELAIRLEKIQQRIKKYT